MRIKFISDSQGAQTVFGSSFDNLLVITKEENRHRERNGTYS